jgi:hypothetical protein
MRRLFIIMLWVLLVIIAAGGCIEGDFDSPGQNLNDDNNISTTGPGFYSLGRGLVSPAYINSTPPDPSPDTSPADLADLLPGHSVYNVMVDRQSAAILEPETRVNFSFDYLTSHPAEVLILGEPLFDGEVAPSVQLSPSREYSPGTGSGSGYFTFPGTATVDQFRIRLYAAGSGEILHERVFAVDYRFRETGRDNETAAPQDPDRLQASFTFSPASPDKKETVIFDAGDSESALGPIEKYIWDFGDGTTISSEEAVMEKSYAIPGTYSVELTVLTTEGQMTKTRQYVPVVAKPVEQATPIPEQQLPPAPPDIAEPYVPEPADDSFSAGGVIKNVRFDPPPPERLPLGSTISFSFDYRSDLVQTGDVLIFTVCPMAQGEVIGEELFPCTTIIRDSAGGSVSGSFAIRQRPVNIHQVRIRMHLHLSGEVVAEKVVSVDYIISAR